MIAYIIEYGWHPFHRLRRRHRPCQRLAATFYLGGGNTITVENPVNIQLHQGGEVFLQLEAELANGTIVNFAGAASEVVADPTLVVIATNPLNASQISVTSVGNIGDTTVTVTYTNPDGTTAVLVLNVTVIAPDATTLAAAQIGGEVAAGTPFPGTPTAPAVSGISPNTGAVAGGTAVSISGTGFAGATAVNFGTVAAASFTVNSATSISAVSPALAAGAVDVTVVTPAGTSAVVAADQFTAS